MRLTEIFNALLNKFCQSRSKRTFVGNYKYTGGEVPAGENNKIAPKRASAKDEKEHIEQ
jgi:hypothetical protein